MASSGSSVFLSNVDDYLGPSQACVNPLFSTDKDGKKIEPAAAATTSTAATSSNNTEGQVVPRRRRPRAPRVQATEAATASTMSHLSSTTATTSTIESTTPASVVRASLVDCLACSGCVTTAETVLLEEKHSLQKLRNWVQTIRGGNNNINTNSDATTTTTVSNASSSSSMRIVATISPAAWADLLRHVSTTTALVDNAIPTADADATHPESPIILQQRKITRLLYETLAITTVLDGNIPLQWSRQEAAREFCAKWKKQQQQQQQTVVENGGEKASDHSHESPRMSLLSSSCPATVCLVEKSVHGAVPHLATTKSPMSCAGVFWKQLYPQQQLQLQEKHKQLQTQQENGNHHHNGTSDHHQNQSADVSVKHVAIMPCHDKKLEASRKEFVMTGDGGIENGELHVDLVLTTQECVQLMEEMLLASQQQSQSNQQQLPPPPASSTGDENHTSANPLSQYLTTLPPSEIFPSVAEWMDASISNPKQQELPALILDADTVMVTSTTPSATPLGSNNTTESSASQAPRVVEAPSTFFVPSSGGYADYIFRYAATELFGVDATGLPPPAVLWQPIMTVPTASTTTTTIINQHHNNNNNNNAIKLSARVAAQQRRREFYQATLYRCSSNNNSQDTYATTPSSASDVPVLRFAMANGMQTVQKALQSFQEEEEDTIGPLKSGPKSSSSTRMGTVFDYMEIMACPSGCINGGGQIRVSTRETPTETRQRVWDSQSWFLAPAWDKRNLEDGNDDNHGHQNRIMEDPAQMSPSSSSEDDHHERLWHTSYQVIAPLQHSLGAAAGVAVRDTQW